jgi:hypothetical protein
MASKGNWTIVFDDKLIIKNHAEGASEGVGYKLLMMMLFGMILNFQIFGLFNMEILLLLMK